MTRRKTIGELRAEGKSWRQIAKIGEKELRKTEKGRKALRRLKRSVGGRGGRPGKTQAQVQTEEKQRLLLEAKKKADREAKLKEEKRLRALEEKRIKKLKAKLEKEKAQKKAKVSLATKKQLMAAKKRLKQKKKIIEGTIQPTPSPKTRRKIPFIKTIAEVEFEGREEQRKGKKVTGFVKRASADIAAGTGALLSTARDLSTVTTALRNSPERIAAQQRLSAAFSLTSLKAIGPSIGRDMTSNNPYERVRGIVSFLGLFLGTPVKDIKPKVQTSASTYNVKTNIASGSTKVNVETKGTLDNGAKFSQTAKLRYNPEANNFVGKSTTTSKGKKITEILNFKDKGGFYQDVKSGKKIDKTKVPLEDIKVSIKETRTKQVKPDITRTYKGNVIKTGQRSVKVTKTDITIKNGKKTTVARSRKNQLDFLADVKEAGTKLKRAISIPKLLDVKVTRAKTTKARALDERKVQGFLKAIRYDVDIINGLDKRTRLARALGLRKTSPTLKKFEVFIKKGTIVTRKGTLKGRGFTETIRPIKFAFGTAFPKLKLKPKKLSKTKIKQLYKIPKDITVPKLKVKIKNIKKFKLRGLLPIKEANRVIDRMRKKSKDIEQKKKTIKKQVKKTIKKPVKKITPVKKIKAKVQVKNKPISKTTTKPKKAPIKKSRVPRIKTPIKLLKSVRVIRLNTGNLKKSGNRQGYIVQIKKGNKIVTKTRTLLPENRATNVMRHILDISPQASGQIVPRGRTNIVDVKKTILAKKFRTKRSKKTKVLRVVEKRKYRLDKPKEKRIAKLKKKRTVKKTKKKK